MLAIPIVSPDENIDIYAQSGQIDRRSSPITPDNTRTVQNILVVVAGRLFRDGLEMVLQREGRKIVGKCEILTDISATVEVTGSPDLCVVSLGDGEQCQNTLSLIREVKPCVPAAKWIVVCKRRDEAMLREAIEAGVDGVLFEDSPGEVLQLVVDLVLHGYCCVPTSVASPADLSDWREPTLSISSSLAIPGHDNVAPKPIQTDSRPEAAAYAGFSLSQIEPQPRKAARVQGMAPELQMPRSMTLSEREKEILQCLVGGHSNKLIARHLQISEATVKVHVKALLRKMRVANRTQAAICALNLMKGAGDYSAVTEQLPIASIERANAGLIMAGC